MNKRHLKCQQCLHSPSPTPPEPTTPNVKSVLGERARGTAREGGEAGHDSSNKKAYMQIPLVCFDVCACACVKGKWDVDSCGLC